MDGHDVAAVSAAIEAAKGEAARPTLICCKTVIGQGAPTKAGTHDCHGAPLGAAEIAAARERMGWPHAPFEIPVDVAAAWDARVRGRRAESEWEELMTAYRRRHPELAVELERRLRGDLPSGFEPASAALVSEGAARGETIASRKASQNAIQSFSALLPELVGGSADLAPSNLTQWKGCRAVTATEHGNYLHYGVREFGMAAILNGLVLHGGVRPFAGTFLMFSEYARNALRMAALMKIAPIYVFTHDSIGLGEDGPTHQPVEQTGTLRMIPNFDLWRPCDAVETMVAWQQAVLSRDHPTALVLSRQNLPHQPRDAGGLADMARGGYVLRRERSSLRVVLIGTGSEVTLACEAAEQLEALGHGVRVVSMPSVFAFDRQTRDYIDAVLPVGVPRVAVEAGHPEGWYRFVGLEGAVVGIQTFGESAPAPELYEHFGITASAVKDAALAVIAPSTC